MTYEEALAQSPNVEGCIKCTYSRIYYDYGEQGIKPVFSLQKRYVENTDGALTVCKIASDAKTIDWGKEKKSKLVHVVLLHPAEELISSISEQHNQDYSDLQELLSDPNNVYIQDVAMDWYPIKTNSKMLLLIAAGLLLLGK